MTPYPISSYVSNHVFSDSHKAFMAAIMADDVPKSFKEAVKQKVWNDAMFKKVDAFEVTDTWEVSTLPPGKKPLGNMWLYSNKYNELGEVERKKARLVVLGNNQRE